MVTEGAEAPTRLILSAGGLSIAFTMVLRAFCFKDLVRFECII